MMPIRKFFDSELMINTFMKRLFFFRFVQDIMDVKKLIEPKFFGLVVEVFVEVYAFAVSSPFSGIIVHDIDNFIFFFYVKTMVI